LYFSAMARVIRPIVSGELSGNSPGPLIKITGAANSVATWRIVSVTSAFQAEKAGTA
jgi:hypothetical protein